MLFRLLSGSDLKTALIGLVLSMPAIVLCLAVHELSHGVVAYALGDRTAKNAGRLTMDPFAHIDPVGFMCMMIFGFGWAKPVPVNISNFKNKARDMAITALAGPASNLILAFVFFLIYIPLQLNATNTFVQVLALFFSYAAQLSIGLGLFNLIPIYPFDGSRILDAAMPLRIRYRVGDFMRRYQSIIVLIVIVLVWMGALDTIMGVVTNWIYGASINIYALLGVL